VPNDEWLPLKRVLYGPNGLYPAIRYRDALKLFPVIRRMRARGGTHHVKFVRESDVVQIQERIAESTE
jgi:hypothetical protein